MKIANVQLVRKFVLAVGVLFAVTWFVVTRSTHEAGGLLHEAIEWIGLLMMFICIAGRCWTSLYIGGRKIDQFVTIGPYSVMRNPLYTFSILGAVGAGAQLGSIFAGLFTGFVVWVVFSVVVRSEERLLLGIYGKEFEDYRAQVPRFFPNPRLWRDIPTILVMPSRMVRTFGDGMMFLLSVPLADLVERFQDAGLFPILFHIA
jgi:protein-S-isoprenylcysteine O-methyltransferase Ste14